MLAPCYIKDGAVDEKELERLLGLTTESDGQCTVPNELERYMYYRS